MTDKQIIIDGVDVSECPHRKKEVTFMNIIKCYNYGACEGVNCLYKQLKRKEQENEELIGKFKQITVLLPQHTKNLKEAKMLLNFDKLVADCARYKTALKEINKKLELALDTEQTDTEESFNLLYEIQDILTEVMEEE